MQEVPVRVAVRVRPFLPQEKLHHHESCVRVVHNSSQVIVGRDRAFTFDHVLSSKASQEEVYKVCVHSLVGSFFEGYNATVFAYGQTEHIDKIPEDETHSLKLGLSKGLPCLLIQGSGKTYTVGGQSATTLTEDEHGIIPRAVQHMFSIIKENHNVDYSLNVSYIEIYKEELKDLLDLDTNTKEMHIREDERGNTVVIGATEVACESQDEVLSCLALGSTHRHTGATNMNEVSSRSHSISTIALQQRWEDPASIDDEEPPAEDQEASPNMHTMAAKFHFVDLAGSERAHKTGNAGERFKESVFINSGLLSLGNVISALSDPKRRGAHIPYRDSKITRILKDSLGGNAKTCMITCISPSAVSFDETLNALKYANRARNIRNKPIINRDVNSSRIAAMQTEIEALREELQRHQSATSNRLHGGAESQRVKDLESTITRLKTQSAHYQVCTEEASKLLSILQDNERLTEAEIVAIRNWLDLAQEAHEASNTTQPMELRDQHSMIADLEQKLRKALDDLASDEEIFSTKTKENNELLTRIKELEKEYEKTVNELEGALTRLRQQEQELIEQQTIIQELQTNNKTADPVADSLEAPLTGRRRPMSVPAHLSGIMRTQSAADGETRQGRPQSRKLHTSPPLYGSQQTSLFSSGSSLSGQVATSTAHVYHQLLNTLFSLERIVQGFRARSHLILKRLEEQDAVMLWEMTDSSNDENDDTQSGVLGQTWSKSSLSQNKSNSRKSQAVSRAYSAHDTNTLGGTISKASAASHLMDLPHVTSQEMQGLRSSTVDYQNKVRESKLRVQEAQQKMRDLALNIRLKEELIRELVKTGREAETANKKFTERIMELEKEAQSAKAELHDTQDALQRLGAKEHQETQDKDKLTEEHRRKMDKARSRVKELQRKQQETEKMLKVQGQSEKKVVDLELAVGRMKQHQELLQQRLKDEVDRKLKLEKEMQKDQQRIRELEIRMDQQQKILKRKTEEVVVAHRKLRQGSAHGDEHAKLEEQRKWMDQEVDRVLERKRKVQELEQELSKREEIIAKKEQLLKEKSDLEMKKLRSSQTLTKDLRGLSSRIESVDKQLEEKQNALRVSVEALSGDITAHIKTLKRDRDRLVKQRSVLDIKLGEGAILSPNEERRLIELEEGIDALDAAIEFKNEVIASRQQELHKVGLLMSDEVLAGRLQSFSAADATSLLIKYFEKVIDLRETDKKKDLTISEMEMKLDEQSRLLRELESALQRSTLELDRKLMAQQKQHEQRVQMLIRQQADGDSSTMSTYEKQISDLEKDLYYYKKTCRELKKKLRQVVAETAASTGPNGTGNDEMDRSQETRPGVTPVRKSRREVRELSAAELSVRRSGVSQASVVADSIEMDSGNGPSAGNPWN